MTELLILSVGNESHEPTLEQLKHVQEKSEEEISEEFQQEHDIIVLPYYITPFMTDEDTLEEYDIDPEKLSNLKEVLEKIENEDSQG